MYLEIEKSRLIKPLALVTSVVEKRQTLPILSNLYLKLEDGCLTLIGTDLEVEISFRIDGVTGEDGVCTVTARKFYDICRALPDSAVLKFQADGNGARFQSGRSRFKLQTLPADDFPKLDTKAWEERLKISEQELKGLLEATAFSMAQQDVRYFLNGVLLEVRDDFMRAVATDGHRLAKSETRLEGGEFKFRQSIIPRKAVLEMMRFLEDTDRELTLEINPNHIRLNGETSTLTTKLIDGRFPDYETVMAQNLSVSLMVDRAEVIDVLNRTAILTNEKFRGIRVHLGDNLLTVTAHNPDQEEASDEIPIEYEGSEVDIGFNVNYLLDALKAVPSSTVEIRLQDTNSGCVVRSPDSEETLYLVMPMRL
ncbi:MAG: DNA polymerase III subunit beta [Proteobacteria bacterium]|nr:MAG: DNA polymerase III subunit beta [Pseudomonadota bacterium]